MSQHDPIADMLTRIRNASSAYHDNVEVPASRMNLEIAKILRNEGFIKNFRILAGEPQSRIRLRLKYVPSRERVINGVKRVSRPGQRCYVGKGDVPSVLGGLGIAILSTSSGVMPDRQARKQGVGGEVVCHVW